jgi:CheY-like chemotaxis protein
MGGKMWLRSRKDVGSGFSFTLHLERQAELSEQTTEAKAASLQSDNNEIIALKILIAEDNQMNQRVMTRLLELLGHQPHVAKNGVEAVTALNSQNFDLILMDCHMPEMDGYEATRAIRELESQSGRHIPIIGLTAATMQQELDQCLAAGMDEYVTKPVPKDILQEKLQSYARRMLSTTTYGGTC